ncbi:fibrous sheath-interacting protein 2-like [Conger conger]|uniref:fibrous sheath-interacting protein 2-like n=1 Tax=Conger conger TaxID=82655 RepID=UPI002A5A6246|nr:fibrous sheath-interacting protein 2-like [Conger conger]
MEQELQLPKINAIRLQDGTSAPFQLTRRRISTDKIPVPSGVRLTLTRGMLGDGLYQPTTDFVRTGPLMSVPDPLYNNLHDPHLRHFFTRQDRRNLLKDGDFITDDDEVICSLKDYNSYEVYLRNLKKVANKTYDATQTARMMKVMELQKRGRVPRDVRLEEVVESILAEDSKNLRKRMQTEAVKKKLKGQTDVENESQQNEEALYTELDLLFWKAEDRARLTLYEKQYRHEQNRELFLKEVQEQKDRRKQALVDRKCSSDQMKLQEKMRVTREAELKTRKALGRDGRFWEMVLEEPRRPPASRPCGNVPPHRSGAARVYRVNASNTFQNLPTIQRKFPEKAKTSQDGVIAELEAKLKAKPQEEDLADPSLGETAGLLPLRPRLGRAGLTADASGPDSARSSEAHRKLPSLELELECSDQ